MSPTPWSLPEWNDKDVVVELSQQLYRSEAVQRHMDSWFVDIPVTVMFIIKGKKTQN